MTFNFFSFPNRYWPRAVFPTHYWPGGDVAVGPGLVTGGGAGHARPFREDEITVLLLAAIVISKRRYYD